MIAELLYLLLHSVIISCIIKFHVVSEKLLVHLGKNESLKGKIACKKYCENDFDFTHATTRSPGPQGSPDHAENYSVGEMANSRSGLGTVE
jgi:hypothetical protein